MEKEKYKDSDPGHTDNEGAKFDLGKNRYDLVPGDALDELVAVYTYGVQKYNVLKNKFDLNRMLVYLKEELTKCNYANTAIKIDLYMSNLDRCVVVATENGEQQITQEYVNIAMLEDLFIPQNIVDPVMIKYLKKKIQNMLKDKKKINVDGQLITLIEWQNIKGNDTKIQKNEDEIKELNIETLFCESGLQKKTVNYYYKLKEIDAQFVEEDFMSAAQCILIMTKKQEKQEDIYVVGATTVLECLVTMLLVLKKQLNIFKSVRQVFIQNDEVVVCSSGDNNWRKGMKWGRVFGALMRHAWAFWRGEDIDKESGHPHMAHAAWQCLTLMNYCKTHPELDDRVKDL